MPPTLPALEPPQLIPITIVQKQEPPKTYTFQPNDSLTKVSELYTVDLSRLWAKNTQLTDPDLIPIGTVVTIPEANEILAERAMIDSVNLPSTLTPSNPPSGGFSSSGNTYTPLYCTWYVKNQLGWVRNGWGDAIRWKANAQAQGFTVSATPSVGSVAWTKSYGHVSIVRSIGDGVVTVQEMNFRGRGVVSTRTAPISEFLFIST